MQIEKTYKNQKVKESGGQKYSPLVIYDHLVLISYNTLEWSTRQKRSKKQFEPQVIYNSALIYAR
jgi:hypothetical protein